MKNISLRDERRRYSEESSLRFLHLPVAETDMNENSYPHKFQDVDSSDHEYAHEINSSQSRKQSYDGMDSSSFLLINAPEYADIDEVIIKALETIITSCYESVTDEDLVDAFITIFDADILDEPLQEAVEEILMRKRETSKMSPVVEEAFIQSTGVRQGTGLVYTKSSPCHKSICCGKKRPITGSDDSNTTSSLDLTAISTFSDSSKCSSTISNEKRHLCAHYRLHYNSKRMQAQKTEGKKRRQKIEHPIATRHRLPVFSPKKISLSRANDIYRNSLEKLAQVEQKKVEIAKELGVTYHPRFI